MDLFASAIGNIVSHTYKVLLTLTNHHHQTEMTSMAYDAFWRHKALHSGNKMTETTTSTKNKYLDTISEGTLIMEAQDIAEELKIMKRVFSEQLSVTKDLKRYLHSQLEKDSGLAADQQPGEIAALKRLLIEIIVDKGKEVDNESNADKDSILANDSSEANRGMFNPLEETLHEAEGTLELIESRQAEIQELEDSILWTCQQVGRSNMPSTKRKYTNINIAPRSAILKTAAGVHCECRREYQAGPSHYGLHGCQHLLRKLPRPATVHVSPSTMICSNSQIYTLLPAANGFLCNLFRHE